MTEPQPFTPFTLPVDDNVNPYAFCLELSQPWFMRKGAMIAYYGQAKFEALAATTMAGFVATRFSSPLYALDWVVAQGQGKVVIGDRGHDINSFDLEDGNLTIRANNLLSFATTLELKQSIVPGFLTLYGTGKFIASSNGPVIFAEPPMRVDPEALVGWADCPAPCHHFDAGWMQSFLGMAAHGLLGVQSGEERQMDFVGSGTILMQSSEVVSEDPAVVRMIESQLNGLGTGGLQRIQQAATERLAANSY
jgi:uncharacterized protein (AIM24 family)